MPKPDLFSFVWRMCESEKKKQKSNCKSSSILGDWWCVVFRENRGKTHTVSRRNIWLERWDLIREIRNGCDHKT